jgi:hypothetical protein
MKALLEEIKFLLVKYVGKSTPELRELYQFQTESGNVFARLGDRLWSPAQVDRSAWLVDATVNNWEGK